MSRSIAYARSGDVNVAYEVSGEGPIDLVLVAGFFSHLEIGVLATMLFTDIVGSTDRVRAMGDAAWAELLARHHAAVRDELPRFSGIEVDTTGDGFLARFDGPARAIRCGLAIRDALREIGIEVRVGIHTGEVELAGEGLRGIAVHLAARILGIAAPGEVLVSRTTHDLVEGAGMTLTDRGEHDLKGIDGSRRVFAAA